MTDYFLADTHFGHKNIVKETMGKDHRRFNSVEEHDNYIANQWKKVVRKGDRVFLLGDVAFGKKNLEILGNLPGLKYLIMGNHDCYSTETYLKYFHKVLGSFDYHGYLLTHIPVSSTEKERWKGNIHGHLHSVSLHDDWYRCVSMEQLEDYTPIMFNKLCS